ncbi:hypothetical protein HJC23_003954 [Cyclotella cryptica]|uniref:C2 NT-type domain-containing protein n=1 Tax=Cyclotella cryptica TaxID=29204 RepID=A0ABD3PUM9_9STRA
MKDATTAAAKDSPRTVASKVSFDPPPVKPPKLQHVSSKPLRINFLRRKAKSQDEDSLAPKAKSQDEDEIDDDEEAEIKRLQRKVEYLEKKKKLVQKIKKIERGIEAVDVESDDEATWEKEKVSPKRWPSFRLKRRKNRDRSDSFEDDLTFDDDDNSPLLEKFHSALDYIEDSCSPIIHEIKDLTVVCTELFSPSKENDESGRPERMNIAKRSSKEVNAAPVPEQDAKSKTDEVAEDSQVSSLAPMLIMLSKQISQSFSRTEDAVDDLQEQEKISSCDAQVHGTSGATNVEAGLETASTQGQERDNAESAQILGSNEQALGLMDNASKASSESWQSLVFNQDAHLDGLDCLNMQPAKPDSEPAISPGNETDAKFVEVTVTAMVLSGLAISSKTNQKGRVPPVHAVLSVLNDTTSGEGPAFTHVPSLRVVNDPSRGPIKKNKFDRSAKYHVMGVWDISKKDGTSISGEVKSSFTFSRFVGMSKFDMIDKKREVTISPSILHLRVCVMRDDRDDILPVGVAKVLISGWEPRDVELAVPVRPEYYKSISDLTKKLNTKPPQSKWESFKSFALEDEDDVLSCVRFRGFKNETYRLEKDSFLRIRLKIAPYIQGQQSQLSGSIPLAKNTTTRGDSEVLTVTRELTECQDTKSISLPGGPHAYFVHNSASVENSEGQGGHPPGSTQSFGKVDSRVEAVADMPTIDTTDPCTMVNSKKNKENTSNGVAPPYKLVDESLTEKMVSQKSRKVWFKKSKSTDTRKAKVSTRSQPMLDKKWNSENNPEDAVGLVDTAFQSSRELKNHGVHPLECSSSSVVEATPTVVDMACPENTVNYVAPVDGDTAALSHLEENHIDPCQAKDITGLNGSKDAHQQATSDTNVESNSSALSTGEQSGKDVVLKSKKSWFKKTLKISQTDHPKALCLGSSKEPVLSDPSLAPYSCSSYDRQALVNHEMVADNCNFRQDSSDPNVENFSENKIIETRSFTTVSLKTKEERGFQVISSEVIEDSLQDMNEQSNLSTITASDVDNLRLPAAPEISASKNENSADLQSHCDTVNSMDEVHPQNNEVEEPESQCFCQVDEFMATDIVRGTNCVERDLSQIVSDDEFEVTPDDFLKAAEWTKALGLKESESVSRSNSNHLKTHQLLVNQPSLVTLINESTGSTKAAEDHPCDLSECQGEDCAKKSVASSHEEDGECEGIELELQKKKTRKSVQQDGGDLPSMQKETRSVSNLRSMAGLAGKMSRSKSRKCEI